MYIAEAGIRNERRKTETRQGHPWAFGGKRKM